MPVSGPDSVDHAAYYVVMARRMGSAWEQSDLPRMTRYDALVEARRLLDRGRAVCVVVQGRGTPEHPTPAGEVEIYRGVAAGYSARAFFPLCERGEVDVRDYAR